MSKSMAHPTGSKATQFARFSRSIMDAAALVFDRLGPKESLAIIDGKAAKFAEYFALVFEALKTGRKLMLEPSPFKTLCTVRLGSIKSIDDLRLAVLATYRQISTVAEYVIANRLRISAQEYDLEIVRASGEQLGFTKPATRAEISKRALSCEPGIELLPTEAAVLAAIKHDAQPKGERLYVMMRPEADSHGDWYMLQVVRCSREENGKAWLSDSLAVSHLTYGPECIWLFARRKPAQA